MLFVKYNFVLSLCLELVITINVLVNDKRIS